MDVQDGKNNNALVAGTAGTGKSTLIKSMLKSLHSIDANIVVIDFTGEYAILKKYGFNEFIPGLNFFINPISVFGSDVLYYIFQSLWGKEITPIQYTIIDELASSCDSIPDILRQLNALIEKTRDEGLRNAYCAVRNRLKPLAKLSAFRRCEVNISGKCVLNLSYIPSDVCRTALALTILYYIYYKSFIGEFSAITVIDEAERVARISPISERNIIAKIYDELRKYNLFAWIITHTLDLAPEVINNAYHKIIFRLTNPRDVDIASRILLLPRHRIATIPDYYFFYRGASETVVLRSIPDPDILKAKFKPVKPIVELLSGNYGVVEKARIKALELTNERYVKTILQDRNLVEKLYKYHVGELPIDELPEDVKKNTMTGITLNTAAKKALDLLLSTIENIY